MLCLGQHRRLRQVHATPPRGICIAHRDCGQLTLNLSERFTYVQLAGWYVQGEDTQYRGAMQLVVGKAINERGGLRRLRIYRPTAPIQ